MDVIHECCAGLDVHKKTVAACVRHIGKGGKVSGVVREFNTMTKGILELGDWLEEQGVTHVAMESTGVYWKPIWNLLEERFSLLLCNARHVKNVPGRKTDVRDCQWLAQLLQYGLLTGSFIPARPQRELRDLTRHRAQLAAEKTRVANRLQKILEDANIKLSSVASDILGVSGRAMLEALIAGQEDPEALAELARRRLRGKIPKLQEALNGHLTDHHRYMLGTLYDHLQYLEGLIADMEERIDTLTRSEELNDARKESDSVPFDEAVDLLDTVPGIDRCTAQGILAELGTDMSQFPTAAQLASWAGVCPGSNESAGKRRSGKTTKGNRWLLRVLSQAAWAASRTKGTYLSAQYRRLAARRGRKRAIIALAHSILVAIYHMLEQNITYCDLGPEHFHTITPEKRVHYLRRQLEKLGYRVTIEPTPAAA
jgi:transposase